MSHLGTEVFIVVVGIVLFALLRLGGFSLQYGLQGATGIGSALRMSLFGIIMLVWAGGYLFTFLQSILHSTAAEDRELPDLPGMGNVIEDILLPFLRLLGLFVVCFGPAIGLSLYSSQITPIPALIAWLTGCLYFPMAFLAVAILDSVTSLHPLIIIPSILKAPGEYFVSLLLFGVVLVFQAVGIAAIGALFPEGISTRSLGALFGMLGSYIFLFFATLYLLIVAVHVLGLIYVTKQERLAWHSR